MTDTKDDEIKVIRPFGPSIARIRMPDMLVDNLNNYIYPVFVTTFTCIG